MSPPPPWAVLCWADDNAVYVELPCKDGSFHRESFPLCEAGMTKALNLLRKREVPKPIVVREAKPKPKQAVDLKAIMHLIMKVEAKAPAYQPTVRRI